MRYSPAHAAKSGSVPFMLRGPKSVRTALTAAVAGIVGLVPTVLIASPAPAASSVLSIAAASAAEGSAVTFTLSYTGLAAATYIITTGVGDAPAATAGTDYNATPSTAAITFAGTGSDADQTVSFTTTDDALYEAAETFKVTATNGADPTDFVTAVGTITNNDSPPQYSLSASPTTVSESTPSAKSTITATLSAVSGVDTVVTFNTANGTALAGTDYTALVAQNVTIAAGALTGTKDVLVTADTLKDEADTETFTVNASATNVSPTSVSTTVSITDAQTTPVVTLGGGGAVAEGANLTLPITVAPASEKAITVQWNAVAATAVTGEGDATAGDDFTYASSRTVTLAAGATAGSIVIPITDDTLSELPENFAVELSSPTNATLGTAKVSAKITDGDSAPSLAITPAAVTEGNSGTTSKTYTATLSAAAGRVVKVNWATNPETAGYGKATAVKDFISKSGTLTFPAGTTTQTFTIDVVGDTVDEGAGETFTVVLTNVDGSVDISSPTTTLTITDDDDAPTISFDNLSVKEGDDTSAVLVPLKLNGSSDHPLTFDLIDAGTGTATAALSTIGTDDYDLMNSTITIQPETTTGYAVVLVNADEIYEADETANFTATAATGSPAYITDPDTKTAKLTLENDDDAPNLEINSITGDEGSTVAVTGTVTGTSATDTTLNVTFAGGSSNGSKAASTDDFTNPGSKSVVVTAGTTPGTVKAVTDLVTLEDTVAESAETIIATGTGTSNVGTVTEGIITIAASDGGSEEPGEDAITLEASSSYRLGVGNVTLSGTTTPGAMVQPLAQPRNSDAGLVDYGNEVEADEEGNFSFIGSLSTVGVKFAASTGELVSDTVTVNLKEDPDFTARSSSKGAATLTVVGDPKVRGLAVRVLRANKNGTWTTVGTGILNVDGKFTKTLTGLKSGSSQLYKATVYGNGAVGLLTNTSRSARVTIR